MGVGLDGRIIAEGTLGRADLVLCPLDGTTAQFELALWCARQWRANARTPEIDKKRQR